MVDLAQHIGGQGQLLEAHLPFADEVAGQLSVVAQLLPFGRRFKEKVLMVSGVHFSVMQLRLSIPAHQNAVAAPPFAHLENDVTTLCIREVVGDGVLICRPLPAEIHQFFVDEKDEVEGVDERAFTYVVRAH